MKEERLGDDTAASSNDKTNYSTSDTSAHIHTPTHIHMHTLRMKPLVRRPKPIHTENVELGGERGRGVKETSPPPPSLLHPHHSSEQYHQRIQTPLPTPRIGEHALRYMRSDSADKQERGRESLGDCVSPLTELKMREGRAENRACTSCAEMKSGRTVESDEKVKAKHNSVFKW